MQIDTEAVNRASPPWPSAAPRRTSPAPTNASRSPARLAGGRLRRSGPEDTPGSKDASALGSANLRARDETDAEAAATEADDPRAAAEAALRRPRRRTTWRTGSCC